MKSGSLCSACGGELLQKNPRTLSVSGIIMLALAATGPFFSPILWFFTAPLAVIGIYLIVWSALGQGLWCRTCKRFPIARKGV